jgi:hypothetical protein
MLEEQLQAVRVFRDQAAQTGGLSKPPSAHAVAKEPPPPHGQLSPGASPRVGVEAKPAMRAASPRHQAVGVSVSPGASSPAGSPRPPAAPLFCDVTSMLQSGRLLGRGAFGAVYQCDMGGVEVVVKTLLPGASAKETSALREEVGLLGSLRHPHIVLIMGRCDMPPGDIRSQLLLLLCPRASWCVCPLRSHLLFCLFLLLFCLLVRSGVLVSLLPCCCCCCCCCGCGCCCFLSLCFDTVCRSAFVMERARYGSVDALIRKATQAKQVVPRTVCIDFCHQVAAGMRYLHSQNVVHRDLKSPNVLLDSGLRLKLADFGLSRVRTATFLRTAHAGTISHMAPECFAADEVRSKVTYLLKSAIPFLLLFVGLFFLHIFEISFSLREHVFTCLRRLAEATSRSCLVSSRDRIRVPNGP